MILRIKMPKHTIKYRGSYIMKHETKKASHCSECNRVLTKNGRPNKSGYCSDCYTRKLTKERKK